MAVFSLATPAHAEDAWGDDVQVMTDDEMAAERGGIRLPNGVDVGFGAIVTTYANGLPVLQTLLTWSDAGPALASSIGSFGRSIDSMSPEERTALGLEGLQGLSGVVIADADGVTAVAHNVTDGALQNIILNTASGRDLVQTVDVTLTLPKFELAQGAMRADLAGLRVAADLRDQLAGVAR